LHLIVPTIVTVATVTERVEVARPE
jgi:hypothetical protein